MIVDQTVRFFDNWSRDIVDIFNQNDHVIICHSFDEAINLKTLFHHNG